MKKNRHIIFFRHIILQAGAPENQAENQTTLSFLFLVHVTSHHSTTASAY